MGAEVYALLAENVKQTILKEQIHRSVLHSMTFLVLGQ